MLSKYSALLLLLFAGTAVAQTSSPVFGPTFGGSPGGGGTVTNFTANPANWPLWLIPTVTNPTTTATLTVAATLDPSLTVTANALAINFAHANTWSGAQTFSANTTQAPNTATSSTAAGFAAWTLSARSDTGNAILNLTTVGNAAILTMVHNALVTQALSIGNNDLGMQFTDAGSGDLNIAAPPAQTIRFGNTFGSVSTMQITGAGAVSVTPVTIATGATPAISVSPLQTITLSANATPTVTIASGEHLRLQICQPTAGTGPFTWTWPTSIHGGVTITGVLTSGNCAQQAFDSFNGTTLVAESTGVINVAP